MDNLLKPGVEKYYRQRPINISKISLSIELKEQYILLK